jgi:hypothetical protein
LPVPLLSKAHVTSLPEEKKSTVMGLPDWSVVPRFSDAVVPTCFNTPARTSEVVLSEVIEIV